MSHDHADAFRVEAVSERCVRLTPAERRRLWRMWKAADIAAGIKDDLLADWKLQRALGIPR